MLKIGKVGLEITGKPTFNEFKTCFEQTLQIGTGCQWTRGDLINFAELEHADDREWGHKYDEMIASSGYEYGTLRNWSMQCAHFEQFRRRVGLSWSHHTCVMKLHNEAQEDEYLLLADQQRWTRDDLKDHMARDLNTPKKIKGTEVLSFEGSLDDIIEQVQALKQSQIADTQMLYAVKVSKRRQVIIEIEASEQHEALAVQRLSVGVRA